MSNGIQDANNKVREQERVNGDPPQRETVRGHLREALQALNRLELYNVDAQGADLTRAREALEAAAAMCEQVHHDVGEVI